MKNPKIYVFGLVMCIELVVMCIVAMLAIFWMDTMDKFVFTISIPIIGFLLITLVTELLYRIYTNNQIINLKAKKNNDKSPEEMISMEMAFNRNEGAWIVLTQYFWVTCVNLYIVFSINSYYIFIGVILVQIILALFFGFYASAHNKKCYRDGMVTQAIYYARAYQTLCKELIDYTNEIDKRAREDVVDIIEHQEKTREKTIKELQDDIQ